MSFSNLITLDLSKRQEDVRESTTSGTWTSLASPAWQLRPSCYVPSSRSSRGWATHPIRSRYVSTPEGYISFFLLPPSPLCFLLYILFLLFYSSLSCSDCILQVLQSVLDKLQVKGDKFMPTCIVIDKLDKLERSEIITQLKVPPPPPLSPLSSRSPPLPLYPPSPLPSRLPPLTSLQEIGLPDEAIEGILSNIAIKTLEALGERLGTTDEAYKELSELFKMAEAYG